MRVREGLAAKKKVQGAWITLDDQALLQDETRRSGLRSPTSLASIIIGEWCHKKRVERAEETIQSSRRRVRDGKGKTKSKGGFDTTKKKND